ncbi:hypothetical protein UFOVP274_25 [uncultured Caudovirales phage]|uniref:Uncharacterized protein n=1 Tax=uncultured Caudovirales phage TaxID=2100421 RepID=A0A6J5LP15_9CAUD|nr:hypothetical protein UFOVP274_25 [uncultured Caudovirales phage]
MNYTQLVADIKAYTENDFPDTLASDGTTIITSASQIAQFVQQAELRIYNTVQFPTLRKNVTGNATANNKYVACPDDFLAPYSMAVIDGTGAYTYLLNKDVNFIREAYPTPTSTGLPKFYALFGGQTSNVNELAFILGPTPDSSYGLELHYFYYPTSIVTAGTSWLGDNFDAVLLYGSLIEAYTYMKGEAELIQLYDTKYKEALALAKRLGDGMERRDAYRSGQARVDVP